MKDINRMSLTDLCQYEAELLEEIKHDRNNEELKDNLCKVVEKIVSMGGTK